MAQTDGYEGRDHLDEEGGEDVRKTLTEAESIGCLCICRSLENEAAHVSISNMAGSNKYGFLMTTLRQKEQDVT